MASENRAASSLGQHIPGGLPAFVAAMNAKAKALGMTHSEFSDWTGLSAGNVSTASDLAPDGCGGGEYPLIREFTTTQSHSVKPTPSRRLVSTIPTRWSRIDRDIQLSKTGFISEAGGCLVMMATISSRPVVIVLLDSWPLRGFRCDSRQALARDGRRRAEVKAAKAARFVPAAKRRRPRQKRIQGQFTARLAQAGKARGV